MDAQSWMILLRRSDDDHRVCFDENFSRDTHPGTEYFVRNTEYGMNASILYRKEGWAACLPTVGTDYSREVLAQSGDNTGIKRYFVVAAVAVVKGGTYDNPCFWLLLPCCPLSNFNPWRCMNLLIRSNELRLTHQTNPLLIISSLINFHRVFSSELFSLWNHNPPSSEKRP